MRTFTDNKTRDWNVAVDVTAVRRVRDQLKLDLLDAEGKVFGRLIDDPILMVDVLYVVCKPQADDRSVTDDDFGRGMGGDAIEKASAALLQEIVDFFPSGQRPILTRVLAKSQEVRDVMIRRATEALEATSVEAIVAEVERQAREKKNASTPG